jgi:hypothetical protein
VVKVLAAANRSAMCNAIAMIAPEAIAVDSGWPGRTSIAVTMSVTLHEQSQLRADRHARVRLRLWIQCDGRRRRFHRRKENVALEGSAAGGAIAAFGWTYPHFVTTESWMTYLYASPFGILPCPTFAVVIGVSLMVGHLTAIGWQATLIVAGLLYGAIGVFRLGVVLDWALLLASVLLAAAIARDRLSGTCFPPPLIRIRR